MSQLSQDTDKKKMKTDGAPALDFSEKLLELKELKTYFFTDAGVLPSVDGVSYSIYKGKTLGVVGESGSGKSVTAMSILKLIPSPPGRIVSGEVLFEGRDLSKLSEPEMRKVRGNDISVIFQEPMTSLDPSFTIGNQLTEAYRNHRGGSKRAATERAERARCGALGIGLAIRRVPCVPILAPFKNITTHINNRIVRCLYPYFFATLAKTIKLC